MQSPDLKRNLITYDQKIPWTGNWLNALKYDLKSLHFSEKLPNGTKPKTTPEPCPIGLYACRDRTACVQFTNVCDFEKNCNDNSDEDVCGMLIFKKIYISFM